MDRIAPTAAAVKRRRIEAGEDPLPQAPEPAADEDEEITAPQPATGQASKSHSVKSKSYKGKTKGGGDGDIFEIARQHREEAEARAAADRESLQVDDDVDFALIRRLQIVEECNIRQPKAPGRTRDQDIADGRWDPRWNGRQNFKKFRRYGEPAGRPAPRVIVGLEEVKSKEYGIGDDYWLEEEGSGNGKNKSSRRQTQTQRQAQATQTQAKGKEKEGVAPVTAIVHDSSDEDGPGEESVPEQAIAEPDPPRTKAGKVAARSLRSRQSQAQKERQSQTTRSSKRTATALAADERPTKKPRLVIEVQESDESDDELKFRFGRRK
jgi:DNA repair protein XRS2